MRCEDFQAAVLSGAGSSEILEHLRACEACLNFAIGHDPDFMFRAIGGELEPPGGADAFAAEVMHQIHVRDTERRVSPREGRVPRLHRWALAAAATFMVVSGAMLWPRSGTVTTPIAVVSPSRQAVAASALVRPVVESWGSSNAMIIEIPEEETSDLKVVMIFDESLPADI
jgi:hypothetical protein